MKKTLNPIGATGAGADRLLSKGQKAFNALIARIEKRRASLAEWEAFGPEFQRRYNDEFEPLKDEFDTVRIQMVQRLDGSYGEKALTKGERQTVADLICYFAELILPSVDDPSLAEIYERYKAPDADVEAEAMKDLRNDLKATFDIDIGDDVDLSSPDDILRHVQEQLDKRDEQARAERAAYHAKRKKTPKQEAAEERARAEQAEIHLSIREVYRKLASVLHPDRESDPVERERKVALMKRVNTAHASRSLLDLLEIQLELEHIDQAALENVGEEKLKRWNAILKQQLSDLDTELGEVQLSYLMKSRMNPMSSVTPKNVKRVFTAQITSLREHVKLAERDMRVFDDIKRLKPWLKRMKFELAAQHNDHLFD
nr:hypothetical protein [Luteibacter rhizovicinus]